MFLFAQPEKWNICASITDIGHPLFTPLQKTRGKTFEPEDLWSSTSSMFISSHLSHPTVNRGSRASCSNPWVQVWHVKCSDKIIVNWWMFYPVYRSHVWSNFPMVRRWQFQKNSWVATRIYEYWATIWLIMINVYTSHMDMGICTLPINERLDPKKWWALKKGHSGFKTRGAFWCSAVSFRWIFTKESWNTRAKEVFLFGFWNIFFVFC